MMATLPESKYHLRNQQADALLAPVHASLAELEQRVQHYLNRVRLSNSDEEALAAAHDVLASASAEIARILTASREIPRD